MPKNNAQKWAYISLFISIISVVMIIMGFIVDSYNFYWMIIVGVMLWLTFFICFFVFLGQAIKLNKMFNNKELLAHWYLGSSESLEKVEAEYKQRKQSNRWLLIVITAFMIIIGGLFVLFGFDDIAEAFFFILIMLGVLLIVYMAAIIAPFSAYRKMKKSVPEVYVSTFGAWVMGEYVQWKAPLTRITGVNFICCESGYFIAVNFEIFQRYGYQPNVYRIPVPEGKESEARKVGQKIADENDVCYNEC